MILHSPILIGIFKHLSSKSAIEFSKCCKKIKSVYDNLLYINNKKDIENYISLTNEYYIREFPHEFRFYYYNYYMNQSQHLADHDDNNCGICKKSNRIVRTRCRYYFGNRHSVCDNCTNIVLSKKGYVKICNICYNLCHICNICKTKFISDETCDYCGDKICINCRITHYEGTSCNFSNLENKCVNCINPESSSFCKNLFPKILCRRDIIICKTCKNTSNRKFFIKNSNKYEWYCQKCFFNITQKMI